MSSIGNKKVFSKNLRSLMEQQNKDRKQICNDLRIKYTTNSDWNNGNKYPRIDKIEMLADYFGVLKSDLIEDKTDSNNPAPINDTSLKFALWGDTDEITDADLEDVRRYAEFIKERKKHNGND